MPQTRHRFRTKNPDFPSKVKLLLLERIPMQNVLIQNKETVLDINAPFMPFGNAPKRGDAFYIGSNDLADSYLN